MYLVVHIDDHPKFKRLGADLFYKKKITLLEALTGFTFTIEHLDGEKFLVSSLPGEVICHSNEILEKN